MPKFATDNTLGAKLGFPPGFVTSTIKDGKIVVSASLAKPDEWDALLYAAHAAGLAFYGPTNADRVSRLRIVPLSEAEANAELARHDAEVGG